MRAPGVFGPGDPNLFKLVMAARVGVLVVPARADVQLSWIYVDDLVEALILAARARPAPRAGRLPGRLFRRRSRRRPRWERRPSSPPRSRGGRGCESFTSRDRLCLFGGYVIDLWNSVTGATRLLTRDKMREGLAGTWTCRVGRAERSWGTPAR